ncbi:HAD family hydrolase [Candidatus Woesearchaeota archaeon]|nr:HAD family hydrolase [Candidatus Woesearchaeota archaeon]
MAANFDILFCDWSGCISNDLFTVYNAHKKTIKQFGKKTVSLDEWRRLFTSLKALYFAFGVELPISAPYRDYPEFYEDVVNEGLKPTVYPETPAVLERISREVPIVIVSAQMQYALDREAEEYGVRKFLTRVYGDVQDKAELILREKGSAKALFVEDMIEGIRAGKRAKVTTVAVTRGYHFEDMLRAEHADFYIDNLKDLERIIF